MHSPAVRPVVLAASVGGHLTEALAVGKKIAHPSILITTSASMRQVQGPDVHYLPDARGIAGWIANAFDSLLLTLRLRPILTIGFGSSGVAFFCFWSRLLGSRLVLIETFARVKSPSRFLRTLSLVSHRNLVQWPKLRCQLPRSTFIRPFFTPTPVQTKDVRTIFVAAGTHRNGMDRLVRLVEDCWPLPGEPSITYQIGYSRVIPVHGSWYRWKPPKGFSQDLSNADLVITHDGASTIGQAMEAGKPIIIVPRNQSELDYPMTAELAVELTSAQCVLVAGSREDLLSSIQSIDKLRPLAITTTDTAEDWLDREYARAAMKSRPHVTKETA
jgi:UDP-N-acetylglucosamine--N-acetylmuramyl-(pentapeptide) pyrophosphoryl-undecaprenol N-acetylglucosamine transferase